MIKGRIVTSPCLPGVRVWRARFEGPLKGGILSDDFILWQLLAGGNEEWCERRVATVVPGSVQLVNPGELLRPLRRFGAATEDLSVSLTAEALAAAYDGVEERRSTLAFPHFQTSSPRLLAATRALGSLLLEGESRPLALQTAFADLGNALASERGTLPELVPAPEKLRRLRDYLHAHFAEQVSLADLEAVSGLKRFYIVRQFRAVFGTTPHAYQTHVRLLHARRLLTQDFPLSQIGIEVGFSDQSHFYRYFKRGFGVTPRQYRDAHPPVL